jgi:small subunit ribosomal protein S6
MPKQAPLYDLMLLLSTEAEDDVRAKILADVDAAIAAGGGSIERNDDWGRRTMTFEIDHQKEAEYRLVQFTGPPSLLDGLSHSLKIADGVLRFRIIKVLPGTPPAPDPASAAAPVPAAVSNHSDQLDDSRSSRRESYEQT